MGSLALFGLAALLFSAFALTNVEKTAAAITTFEVDLTGAQENPPVTDSTGSAFARFTFDEQTGELTYALTVSGLSPNLVTAAHIHRGAPGVNGPVVHGLSDTGFTQVSGTIQLSPADIADLKAGNFYVNVHSIDHPSGFARGQMYLDPGVAIQASITALEDAFSSGDVDTFLSYFTDAGIESAFGSREDAEGFLASEGGTPLEYRLVGLSVGSESAISVADLVFDNIQLDRVQHTWLLDGVWKIDNEVDLPEVPAPGTKVINMDMDEFSFVYDRAAASSGNVAFHAVNIGEQPHEAVLFRLEGNAQLEDLFSLSQEDALPAGFTFAGANFAPPGGDFTFVFAAPLQTGRYGFVCFIPDTDGIPHAVKGMVSEFTVGGASIRPPSTGDAGLAAVPSASRFALLALGLVSFGGGFGLLVFARRAA